MKSVFTSELKEKVKNLILNYKGLLTEAEIKTAIREVVGNEAQPKPKS